MDFRLSVLGEFGVEKLRKTPQIQKLGSKLQIYNTKCPKTQGPFNQIKKAVTMAKLQ